MCNQKYLEANAEAYLPHFSCSPKIKPGEALHCYSSPMFSRPADVVAQGTSLLCPSVTPVPL